MQRLKIPRYTQWLILCGFVFLMLMTLLRLGLVLAFPNTLSAGELFPAFLMGLRFDLRMVSIACLLIFILGSFKSLHPFQSRQGSRLAFTLWTILIATFALFYVVDFAHYAYLAQRLNGSVLNYAEDAGISIRMVWQTYAVIRITIVTVGAVLLLLGIVRLLYNHTLSKRATTTKRTRFLWGLIFSLVLAVGIFGRLGQFPLRWSDAFSLGDSYKAQVALNPFQSFFSSLSYRHATYDIKQVRRHYRWMTAHLGVTHPDSSTLNFERLSLFAENRHSDKPNVVVVICESFSAYKSSMVDNPLNTTPFFRKIAGEGIYFERCFSPAYGTARGVWAIVTGVPDVQLTNTSSRNPAAVDQHTIINDFAGYEKYYFLGGSASWANIRGLLKNNIRDLHLFEEQDYKAGKIDVWGISDKNLFLEANKILSKQHKPFFAVIQTADNHRPYTIPTEDLALFQKKHVVLDTLEKYGFGSEDEYNAFRYTDFSYQQFIEAARKEPYFRNTLFVFVGDHGIKGSAGAMLPKVFTEQSLTSEHVPLLFYAPSFLKPARYSFPVSQIDVMPTISGIVKNPYRNKSLGKDLLCDTDLAEKIAFVIDIDARRIGVVSNTHYYSYNIKGNGESFASIGSDMPVNLSDSLREKYKNITDAYYETARFLLLNNKKRHLKG